MDQHGPSSSGMSPDDYYFDAPAQAENIELGDTTYDDFSTLLPGHDEYLGHGDEHNQEPGDDAADEHVERSARTATPQDTTQHKNIDESIYESRDANMPHTNKSKSTFSYDSATKMANSASLSDEEKTIILAELPDEELNTLYQEHMTAFGLQPPAPPYTAPADPQPEPEPETLTESNYRPLVLDDEGTPDPDAPQPLYPAYTGHFRTAQDAKTHRRRTRVAPKSKAPDVERVRRYGRPYWVKRIYEAMIDISDISDGESSIHRQRFAEDTAFDPLDLEAAAHHVFDSALAVHERGWNRPLVYHKKVVRGKLTDVSEKSLERRLTRLCLCLKHKKATVDDAIRGGITLALLCDNPEARGFTKTSNNTGNKKRGERLKRAKGTETQQEPGENEDDEEQA